MLGYESDVTVNETLDALRHPKRRRLLFSLLQETEGPGSDARCDVRSVFDYEDKKLRTALFHVHLPKLTDLGFIDWGADDRTIEPGPRWEDIQPILSVIHNHLNELPPALRGTPATRSEKGA